jgi:hypothetical protein
MAHMHLSEKFPNFSSFESMKWSNGQKDRLLRFKNGVLKMSVLIFWIVMSYGSEVHTRISEKYCLHLQD